jgi:hypothetical protein
MEFIEVSISKRKPRPQEQEEEKEAPPNSVTKTDNYRFIDIFGNKNDWDVIRGELYDINEPTPDFSDWDYNDLVAVQRMIRQFNLNIPNRLTLTEFNKLRTDSELIQNEIDKQFPEIIEQHGNLEEFDKYRYKQTREGEYGSFFMKNGNKLNKLWEKKRAEGPFRRVRVLSEAKQ